MKVKDFLKLDTWVLVEKEWLNPTNGELRNTGKVLGPFASGGEALSYAMGLGGGSAFWQGDNGEGRIAYLDKNQALENKDFEEEGFPGYARYFWLDEKLER